MLAILDKGTRFQASHEYAGGMKYRHITVKSERQQKKAVKVLRGLDIQTVIPVGVKMPKGFKFPEEDPKKIIHIAAAQSSVTGQSAYITAPRVTKELERVFKSILPFTKTLALQCGADTERTARFILKNYGIAVVCAPRSGADLTVDLNFMSVNGVSLCGAVFTLEDAPEPPHGADRQLWNYALLESGLFDVLTIER
ncbi:MAG: hypothetical protein FWG36_08090 [Oscillospiraceae bacterium]|nr:hypothetical protein [Oscillospiraceae bacterium]